ncbi:MAG: M48 family metallopeptidase [Campylobacterales bacterium]
MEFLNFFLVLYGAYIAVRFVLSAVQIGFLKKARNEPARLLTPEGWQKAADYGIAKERLSFFVTLVEAGLFVFWAFFGLAWLDAAVAIEGPILKAIVFVNLFLLINYVIELPLGLYERFGIDAKFGFNRSTIGLYAADQLKTLALVALLGSAVIAALAWFIGGFENWWLLSFVFLMAVLVLVNLLFPIVRAKLFDKFTAIDETDLGREIRALMQKTGFHAGGVFKVDASKRDARLNAYFAGLGSTKRVVLFDTLIDKLSQQELLAVLGHELGHFKHNDIYKNIGVMAVLLFGFLALFGNLPAGFFAAIGIESSAHSLMALFLLLTTPLFFFAMPFFNAISRHNEFAADAFGGGLVDRAALKEALIKLVQENVKFPKNHPLYGLFYETHPSVLTRVERLEA